MIESGTAAGGRTTLRSAARRLVPAASVLLMALSAARAETAAGGKPLRIVQRDEPKFLDPDLDPTAAGSSILSNVFEGLVHTDAAGELEPSLAVRWERLGERSWRFVLRDGVRFHDGRPLTSRDVVASLERARDLPKSRNRTVLQSLTEITAEDPRTVRLEAGEPEALLLKRLATVRVVPADAPPEIVEPIGTGPYRVVEYRPGSHLRLAAFADYWRGPAAEPDVDFLFVPEDGDRLRMLRAGEADIMVQLPPSAVAELEDDRDLWVASLLGGTMSLLALNLEKPPFDDPLARQAVDLAIDRPALVEGVYASYARPASQLAGPRAFGYVPGMEPVTRDVETARLLLGLTAYRPGQPVQLETIVSRSDLATALQQQLGEVGLSIEVVSYPWPELLKRLFARDFQALLVSWRDGLLDADVTLGTLVHTGAAAVSYGTAGPAIDRLIDGAIAQADFEARRRLTAVAMEHTVAARVFLPLVWNLELYGVRRDIDWEPRLDGNLELYAIARPR